MTAARTASALLLCLALTALPAEARRGAAPPAPPAGLGEHLVLPPIDTSDWTVEGLNAEIDAIRARYLEVLED